MATSKICEHPKKSSHQCRCVKRKNSCEILYDNIQDIAQSLSEVMVICGIHKAKATAAMDIIKQCFLHYDVVCNRMESLPRKSIFKGDITHDLGSKCLMTYLEAGLAYNIIKRAFKAFYHGTDIDELRNPILAKQLVHTKGHVWDHAARRTVHIFSNFQRVSFTHDENYSTKILDIYKNLYARLVQRAQPQQSHKAERKACYARNEKKAAIEILDLFKRDSKKPFSLQKIMADPCGVLDGRAKLLKEEEIQKEVSRRATVHVPSNTEPPRMRCKECKLPLVVCDCNVFREDKNYGCGPYDCYWMRYYGKETTGRPNDPHVDMPKEHICPIDCQSLSCEECARDSDTDCEYCSCSDSEYEDAEGENYEEEEFDVAIEVGAQKEATTSSAVGAALSVTAYENTDEIGDANPYFDDCRIFSYRTPVEPAEEEEEEAQEEEELTQNVFESGLIAEAVPEEPITEASIQEEPTTYREIEVVENLIKENTVQIQIENKSTAEVESETEHHNHDHDSKSRKSRRSHHDEHKVLDNESKQKEPKTKAHAATELLEDIIAKRNQATSHSKYIKET